MQDKKYLLTYYDGENDYAWFDTEDEVREFLSENSVDVHDCIEIIQCRNIEIK